jgi:hypothetical protein
MAKVEADWNVNTVFPPSRGMWDRFSLMFWSISKICATYSKKPSRRREVFWRGHSLFIKRATSTDWHAVFVFSRVITCWQPKQISGPLQTWSEILNLGKKKKEKNSSRILTPHFHCRVICVSWRGDKWPYWLWQLASDTGAKKIMVWVVGWVRWSL